MSDYRDQNDPLQRNTPYDLNAQGGGGALAWIAAAVLVVILGAFAIGINHTNSTGPRVASNNAPTMNQPASPPGGPASPTFAPAPTNPSNPAPLSPPAQKPK